MKNFYLIFAPIFLNVIFDHFFIFFFVPYLLLNYFILVFSFVFNILSYKMYTYMYGKCMLAVYFIYEIIHRNPAGAATYEKNLFKINILTTRGMTITCQV